MKGYATTYLGMFDPPESEQPAVTSIEIPIIQRDYAQGRPEEKAVRDIFVDALVRAAMTDETAGLDFVYGEVVGGRLRPLDGQQRLTTLFLLHWYVASRAGTLSHEKLWKQFSYATRPSAEFFCRELVKVSFPSGKTKPSLWITDQAWYLYPWRHDPTIRAMLVMLDAIHDRFESEAPEFSLVWERLSDRNANAVSFLLLPISEAGSGEELYIKMNSRGKPLTSFEVFKARLEKALEASGRHKELGEKFDRDWSDVLWPYEGGDFIIDDEFMRYLEFIIDVCEWRDRDPHPGERLEDRAERVFSLANKNQDRNLTFFFHAFDTWVGATPKSAFESLFSVEGQPDGALRLFESKSGDLFGSCLQSYGRGFSLTESLLLFAVLLHRQSCSEGDPAAFASRLRSLRNLAESAPDDVRAEFMPALIEATERLIVDGSLENLTRFNQARVEDERLKRTFRELHPELSGVINLLEDHPLLRGRIYAIDLDASSIEEHARVFAAVFRRENWAQLTGALLTQGDYSRQRSKYQQFGTSSPEKELTWRDLLTAGSREQQAPLRDAVKGLIDHPAITAASDMEAALKDVIEEFCASRESEAKFEWRYYFVKYPIMRTGPSGAYVAESFDGITRPLGYSVCMLNTTTLGGYFRDPYLAAIRDLSGIGNTVSDPKFIDRWEWQERWMTLDSGAAIRCVPRGLLVRPPTGAGTRVKFRELCEQFGIEDDGLLGVHQRTMGTADIDAQDRVELGAELLKGLVEAGL